MGAFYRYFISIFILYLSFSNLEALVIERIGNNEDLKTVSSSLTCLAGGASRDAWADGWRAMIAASHGGDVVTIKAKTEGDSYNEWIYNDTEGHGFHRVNSVSRIFLQEAAEANSPEIERLVENAELIFIQGGDQSVYYDWFLNSRLGHAVERALKERKVAIGGTSAGMAVLGGIDYVAHFSSPNSEDAEVSSEDVLSDPSGAFVDLGYSMFMAPFLNYVLTDTHFSERSREGRPMGFMAKAFHHFGGKVPIHKIKTIASDESTAFCYNEKGEGRAYGEGNVFFLQANKEVEQFKPGLPLIWDGNHEAVLAYVLPGSNLDNSFNVESWTGLGGYREHWWVEEVAANEKPSVKRARF